MDQSAISIPKRRPLRAGNHLVVSERCVHVSNRILKDGGRINRQSVRDAIGELQGTEDRIRVGRDSALELCFDGQRQEGGLGQRGRIANSRRESDCWREADGRGERNGRCQGDRGGTRQGGSGRKEMVDSRLRVTPQEERDHTQQDREKYHPPASHDALAADAKEWDTTPGTDGAYPQPKPEQRANQGKDESGLDGSVNVKFHEFLSAG